MEVEVEMVTTTSVRLTWKRIEVSELQGYKVYYNQIGQSDQQFVDVFDNVVEILDLKSNTEYHIQVAALFQQDGEMFMSVKSAVTMVETVRRPSKLVPNLSGWIHVSLLHYRLATTK